MAVSSLEQLSLASATLAVPPRSEPLPPPDAAERTCGSVLRVSDHLPLAQSVSCRMGRYSERPAPELPACAPDHAQTRPSRFPRPPPAAMPSPSRAAIPAFPVPHELCRQVSARRPRTPAAETPPESAPHRLPPGRSRSPPAAADPSPLCPALANSGGAAWPGRAPCRQNRGLARTTTISHGLGSWPTPASSRHIPYYPSRPVHRSSNRTAVPCRSVVGTLLRRARNAPHPIGRNCHPASRSPTHHTASRQTACHRLRRPVPESDRSAAHRPA